MITIEMELAIENIESELSTMETELEKIVGEMDGMIRTNDTDIEAVFRLATIATTISNMKSLVATLNTTMNME